jgi:integrase
MAERELARLIAEIEQGNVDLERATVGMLLDRWLAHRESLGRSPTTMREYHRLAEKVVRPELGHVRLSKLTARHLDQLYTKLSGRGLKPGSVRRVHALLHSALHQARKWKMVSSNVAEDATPPPLHHREVKAPDPAEVRAIILEAEKAEPAVAAVLLLAALTGARRGELCSLRWLDVDWEAGLLTVARSVYETKGGGWAEKPTKTHQVRRVALDELGTVILSRHRAKVEELANQLGLELPPDGYIFSRSPVGLEPIRPDLLTRVTIRAARAAGVDTHLHALRHFSATQLIASGHDVRTVAGRLGHADPSMTLRVYSHALPERDREAAATLGRALGLPS